MSAGRVLELGFLGENLTVEGLPDNEVCIGERSAPSRRGHADREAVRIHGEVVE